MKREVATLKDNLISMQTNVVQWGEICCNVNDACELAKRKLQEKYETLFTTWMSRDMTIRDDLKEVDNQFNHQHYNIKNNTTGYL